MTKTTKTTKATTAQTRKAQAQAHMKLHSVAMKRGTVECVELTFDEKPDAKVLKALKAEGFKWYGKLGYWGAVLTDSRKALAEKLAGSAKAEPAKTKARKTATASAKAEAKPKKAAPAKAGAKPKAKAKAAAPAKAGASKPTKRKGTTAKAVVKQVNDNLCEIIVHNPTQYREYLAKIKAYGFKATASDPFSFAKDGKVYRLIPQYAQ